MFDVVFQVFIDFDIYYMLIIYTSYGNQIYNNNNKWNPIC